MSRKSSLFAMNEKTFATIMCDGKWVSDGLDQYYRNWNSDNPVLISAQTGRGKNAFILDKLIPYAISIGAPVLILSNRVALEQQQKTEVICKLKNMGYAVPDYSEEELKDIDSFGIITILSYHSCLSKLQLNRTYHFIQEYRYIVFDEAHFFVSDCLFNASSYHILRSIVKNSPMAIHIFMTATPAEVYNKIFEIEGMEYDSKRMLHYTTNLLEYGVNERLFDGKYLTVYEFPYDYSSYNIHFFHSYLELGNKAKNADDEKWLIFVRRKADGQELKKLIGSDSCRYLDSTRKTTTNKAWAETREGIISKKALICTSVIDNGISITEPRLKNIAISAIDRTEVFQMIGRKRLEKNEIINLYLYVPTLKEVSQMITQTEKLLDVIKEYEKYTRNAFLHRNWDRLTDDVRKLFYVTPAGTIVLNELAYSKLKAQRDFLSRLKADMKLYGDMAYPRTVRAWFGISENSDNAKECLNAIKHCLEVEHVDEENTMNFYKQIMNLYEQMAVPKIRKGAGRELASVNEALRNLSLPYKIYKRKKAWRIVKDEACTTQKLPDTEQD